MNYLNCFVSHLGSPQFTINHQVMPFQLPDMLQIQPLLSMFTMSTAIALVLVTTAFCLKYYISYFTVLLSSSFQFSSVAQSCLTPCDPMNHSMPGLPVHHQLPEPTQTHVHWADDDPTISSSVIPFSSCPQSFPASESFQMNQPFASGAQSIRVLASTSVLPMNTQDWSPLGWTYWISLQPKGFSRVFSNTTVQKHQFFRAQLSSPSN